MLFPEVRLAHPPMGPLACGLLDFSLIRTGSPPEPEASVESSGASAPSAALLGYGPKFSVVRSHYFSYRFALQLSSTHVCATFSRLEDIIPLSETCKCYILIVPEYMVEIQSLAFLTHFLQFYVGLCYSTFTVYASLSWIM